MQADIRDSLGQENPLEESMETHSSVLAWRIPWREEPEGLQPMGSQRVRHDWSDLAYMHTHSLTSHLALQHPPASQPCCPVQTSFTGCDIASGLVSWLAFPWAPFPVYLLRESPAHQLHMFKGQWQPKFSPAEPLSGMQTQETSVLRGPISLPRSTERGLLRSLGLSRASALPSQQYAPACVIFSKSLTFFDPWFLHP